MESFIIYDLIVTFSYNNDKVGWGATANFGNLTGSVFEPSQGVVRLTKIQIWHLGDENLLPFSSADPLILPKIEVAQISIYYIPFDAEFYADFKNV